jgi:hypothetical protein
VRRAVGLATLLLLAPAVAACSTQRTLTVHSAPTGARVWVDGKDLGRTPASVPFVHYGTFHVRLEKEGHRPLAADVRVPSEIDGYPLIDLPSELTVRRKSWAWTGTLEPLSAQPAPADLDASLERAQRFRERARREAGEPRLRPPEPLR